ncbi:MAG: IS66 family transposase [bacterium]|nr:IS66 family transposase [bacterium]
MKDVLLQELSRDELVALAKQLLDRVAEQDRRIAALEAELARFRKDSSNSSKPPSSDIVKPPARPRADGGKRHIGGQPGHPRHEHPLLPADRVDRTVERRPGSCPKGHGRMRRANLPPKVSQQVGLVEQPFVVTEYLRLAYWRPTCKEIHYAPLPPEVERAGFFDSRATALVGWLKSRSHGSCHTVQEFLRDIGRIQVSTGFLAKTVQKISAALEEPYAELEAAVRNELRLNVDETGHPENKRNLWTWAFRAALFTLFKIDPSRGSQALLEVLGADFKGVMGCDYFSACRKYLGDHGVLVQFRLAHLIRDVKFLLSLPDPVTRRYGERLLKALRQMFRVIHRREQMAPERFQRKLERAAELVLCVGRRAPERVEAQNLADRFRKHGDAYIRFVTTPGIEPTNNLAEQVMRFLVIDRRITQGTRSERGRRWCERIWTTVATCAQQGRSLFDYLCSALNAHFARHPIPSLLPSGP